MGLSETVGRALHDPRRQASCLHRLVTLVRQRLHALVLGYEDLNDHQTLRHDAGLQTAPWCTAVLASPSTLCPWEQTVTRRDTIRLHQVLFDPRSSAAVCDSLTPPRRFGPPGRTLESILPSATYRRHLIHPIVRSMRPNATPDVSFVVPLPCAVALSSAGAGSRAARAPGSAGRAPLTR